MTDRPMRVAIVGGGCAAMATAFELTRPEHAGRYAVTVYQQGWRLGGKGASGRGPFGRIEEHGLHVWMGWYENAFRLLRAAYVELGRDWRQAFEPVPFIAVTDRTGDGWEPWIRAFPPADGLPGDPLDDPNPWTIAEYMKRTAELVRALITELDPAAGHAESGSRETGDGLRDAIAAMVRYGEIATLGGVAHAASLLQVAIGVPGPTDLLLDFVDAIGGSARRLLEARLEHDLRLRRIWQVIDLAIATIRGNLRFGLLTHPQGFDAIDGYDCREWLLMNGASPHSLDSGYLRGLYDLGFAYEDGDASRPRVSAGQAIRGLLRAFFTYRGAFFWRMTAGMGDVVFAPFYEVLQQRGVRFAFFHRLRDVGPFASEVSAGGTHIESLTFDVQARIRSGGEYRPLVDVSGMPCWPAGPDWTQLDEGERMREEDWQFENHWDDRCVASHTLRVGSDFDFVVLGIGLGAVPHACARILAQNARWRDMVRHVKTVATQAFQLWLQPSMTDLGWTGPPVVLSGFAKPFDTWADMRHLLPAEGWSIPPGALAYFCGVLPDLPDQGLDAACYPVLARKQVRHHAMTFLDDTIRHLWPRAVGPSGAFRWDALVPASASPTAFDGQFWTANVNPTDRYTQALPGTAAFRISPLDAGYDNLTICGDWTDCGYNMGCVEAAVISGRLAAHALSQRPALAEIVGFDHP